MSYKYLCIPIVVDTLVLQHEMSVSAPMADFSQLPYNNGGIDHNANNPFTGETVANNRWENKQMTLGTGVHLHWALPSGLTQTLSKSDGTLENMAVPDQWLVIRTVPNPRGGSQNVTKWVVESSYLYPVDAPTPDAITMPKYDDPSQPFRYMGRKIGVSDEISASSTYLEGLSAVGYGEPSFAAYYPNCYSVFGFHDTDPAQDGTQYMIIGVYRDSNADVLYKFVNEYVQQENESGVQPQSSDILAAIQDVFHWHSPTGSLSPDHCLCYGVVKINAQTQSAWVNANNAQVTFGNTGTEAVSAYLASKIASDFKATIEDQLEATLMHDFLRAHHLDTGDIFREARHTQSFNALPGGTRWIVNKVQINNSADAQQASAAAQVLLPATMGEMLNRINTLQNEYDKTILALLDKQSQLFSDWFKYIAAAYPDPGNAPLPDINLIRWFIQTQSIPSLQGLVRNLGQLFIETDDNGNFSSASASDSDSNYESSHDSLAYRLSWALNGFVQRLQTLRTENEADVQFVLTPSASPRFWQPTEPNILITGDVAKPTERYERYTRTTPLHCMLCTVSETLLVLDQDGHWTVNQSIVDYITGICDDANDPGYATWSGQPWNPILLEWAIDFSPVRKNNFEGDFNAYPHDFILTNYDLLNGAEDLSFKQYMGQVERSPLQYTGQSLLTPYASNLQQDTLSAVLYADVVPTYMATNTRNRPLDLSTYSDVHSLTNWYQSTYFTPNATDEAKANDPYYTMLQALELLLDPSNHFLTQNLSGFNAALLQHESVFQTPLGDPLGSPTAQTFTNLVAAYVGQANRLAPLPQSTFSPIRSGVFKLTTLNIIDTFGQKLAIPTTSVITTENMKGDAPYLVHLQPRIVQPARLLFRWLSANDTTMEMNDMPDTQAICGWLVPNHLDEALVVFDADGKALGEIVASEAAVMWVPALNSADAIYDITRIVNVHLQKTVVYILAQTPAYFNTLLETIANAQGNIDPNCYEAFTNRIFFVGQPIAIIRAFVGLEVMGETAIDQSWDALRTDFGRNHTRYTADVEDIRFPARLGKFEQLNDGLIGYWIEDHGSLTDTFYAPQSDLNANDQKIKTLANADDAAFYLPLSIAGEPVFTTILMDPRANVHATSGILPAKVINIPPSAYSQALSQMEFTFLTAPIMMHTNVTEIPIPAEPGYTWSWLERQRNSWNVVNEDNIISPRSAAAFSGPQRIVEGWLKLKKSNS